MDLLNIRYPSIDRKQYDEVIGCAWSYDSNSEIERTGNTVKIATKNAYAMQEYMVQAGLIDPTVDDTTIHGTYF